MSNRSNKINIQTVQWCHEDSLPQMTDDEFNLLFNVSRVDVVRLYPFVVGSNEERIFIGSSIKDSEGLLTIDKR